MVVSIGKLNENMEASFELNMVKFSQENNYNL